VVSQSGFCTLTSDAAIMQSLFGKYENGCIHVLHYYKYYLCN
jgi:hypothetical protein